ncbi:MAG: hypothetical protein HOJ35_00820 [Bdellovibrionales bacterium]|nr:hypothetical protein [Bdellovibrionales bacterium]
MKLLYNHRDKPSNLGLPDFFNFSSEEVDGIKLFLDIDLKNNKLNSFFYKSSIDNEWIIYLSLLSEMLKSKDLSEIMQMSWESFYYYLSDPFYFDDELAINFIDEYDDGLLPLENLPLSILFKTLNKYLGWHKAIEEKKEKLICRCFGVYENEVLSLIQETPSIKTIDITNYLNAGGGCTNCISDLQEMITDYQSISPVQLLLKTQEIIDQWKESQNIVGEIEVEKKIENKVLVSSSVILSDNLITSLKSEVQSIFNHLIVEMSSGLHETIEEKKEKLICRCFRVYENEILSLIQKTPNIKTIDITNRLNAGGGCATCLSYLQGMITDHQNI